MRLASIVGILIVFATSLDAGEAKTKSSPIIVEKTKLTFDPKTCTSGRGEFYWSYGSCRVEVVGREGMGCIFRYIFEQEMSGDHVATIKVPIDSGPVVIEAKQHSEMRKIPEANSWSGVYTSFTKKQVTQMQLVGRDGVEEVELEPRGVARVSLILQEAKAARGEGSVIFACKVQLDNATGRELKVQSAHLTPFDAMMLVITDDNGKELAQWGSSWHKSPIKIDGEAIVKQGVTPASLVFPVDANLLGAKKAVRVRVIGTLPGSDYRLTLSTETLKVEVK